MSFLCVLYCSISTAHGLYENEDEIGNALAFCFSEGLVKREELFVVSKLWNTFHQKGQVGIPHYQALHCAMM